MKPLIFLLHFTTILFAGNSFSQVENDGYAGVYTWKTPIEMYKADSKGDLLNDEFEMSVFKQKFVVIREVGKDSMLIRILDYTTENTKKNKKKVNVTYSQNDTTITSEEKERKVMSEDGKTELSVVDTIYRIEIKTAEISPDLKNYNHIPSSYFYKYNFSGSPYEYHSLNSEIRNARMYDSLQRYFVVEKEKIDKYTYYREKASLAVGVLNFPFKARITNGGDFSGSFNFGAAAGLRCAKRSYRNWSLSFISGYSVSSVNLDSVSVARNHQILSGNNDFTAFSFSLGSLVEYKKVQVGIFMGWDHLTKINQATFEWDYQGKPWVSVGIGYSIFSNDGGRKTNESDIDQSR